MTGLHAADAAKLVKAMKALATTGRMQLFAFLAGGPARPIDLRSRLAEHGTVLSQPCVANHLTSLVRAGLAERIRGAAAVYSLTPAGERLAAVVLGGDSDA